MVIEPGKIETACYQECNDSEVSERAEASGFGLGRLNQRIQAFKKSIINMRSFPLHDAFPMSLNCTSGFDHGLNATVRCPEVPLFEHRFKKFRRRRLIDFLKVLPDVKGFNGFQIQLRHG